MFGHFAVVLYCIVNERLAQQVRDPLMRSQVDEEHGEHFDRQHGIDFEYEFDNLAARVLAEIAKL